MYTKKKALSALLAGIIAAAAVTGCGANTAAPEGTTSGSVTEAAGTTTAAAADTETEAAAEQTAAAEESAVPEEHTVEKQTFPMRKQLDEKDEITSGEMDIFFIDGKDIPYVDIVDFFDIFGTFYESEATGLTKVEYKTTIGAAGNIALLTRADNDSKITFDTDNDIITAMDLNLFLQFPGDKTLVGLVSVDDGDNLSSMFQNLDSISYDRHGKTTAFDMAKYNIDLTIKDGACYVPLQTLADIFAAPEYKYFLFNGEEVLICGYGTPLMEERYVEKKTMSDDFAVFNYNELRFNLDHFYGLKEEHRITDFAELFLETGLFTDLASNDPEVFDTAIKALTMRYLDDSHSGVTGGSAYSGKPEENGDAARAQEMYSYIGRSMSEKTLSQLNYLISRAQAIPEFMVFGGNGVAGKKIYDYTEIDDTAIITFDGFTQGKDDYYSYDCETAPEDTVELIIYANKQLHRENCPIKNVVIDLSCNGGGSATAAAFVSSWASGMAVYTLVDTLTGAQSVCGYQADVDLDGEISNLGLDAIPLNMKVYCMTSPLSFSCGNLVPASFKDTDVTLIGRTTGGGSCVVRPCSTASGAIMQISGTKQISVLKNGSFYNTDRGVDPDIFIADRTTMYDREALVDFIHNIK